MMAMGVPMSGLLGFSLLPGTTARTATSTLSLNCAQAAFLKSKNSRLQVVEVVVEAHAECIRAGLGPVSSAVLGLAERPAEWH